MIDDERIERNRARLRAIRTEERILNNGLYDHSCSPYCTAAAYLADHGIVTMETLGVDIDGEYVGRPNNV